MPIRGLPNAGGLDSHDRHQPSTHGRDPYGLRKPTSSKAHGLRCSDPRTELKLGNTDEFLSRHRPLRQMWELSLHASHCRAECPVSRRRGRLSLAAVGSAAGASSLLPAPKPTRAARRTRVHQSSGSVSTNGPVSAIGCAREPAWGAASVTVARPPTPETPSDHRYGGRPCLTRDKPRLMEPHDPSGRQTRPEGNLGERLLAFDAEAILC
jgi:hypothetical protein